MLTEGKPGEAEISPFAPVPLVRSVFRRFVNRRTLAWLGLTAAIAVAIWINEQRQPGGQVAAKARPRGGPDAGKARRPAPRSPRRNPPCRRAFKPPARAALILARAARIARRATSGNGRPRRPRQQSGALPPDSTAKPTRRQHGEEPASRTAGCDWPEKAADVGRIGAATADGLCRRNGEGRPARKAAPPARRCWSSFATSPPPPSRTRRSISCSTPTASRGIGSRRGAVRPTARGCAGRQSDGKTENE